MKKDNRYSNYRAPLKPARTLDQMFPKLDKYPSKKYFTTKNVNDIPGHPREDYFSTRWDGIPKRKRYRRKK